MLGKERYIDNESQELGIDGLNKGGVRLNFDFFGNCYLPANLITKLLIKDIGEW